MATSITVNIKPASVIIAAHGLDPNGRAQKFLTHEARRLMDPYVPMRSGVLKGTAVEQQTSVTYVQPYARRQYYEHKGDGLRGREWDKRMMATRGPELIRAVQNYVRSR